MDSLEIDPSNDFKFQELEESERYEKFILEIGLMSNRSSNAKEQQSVSSDHKFEYSKDVVSLGLLGMPMVL